MNHFRIGGAAELARLQGGDFLLDFTFRGASLNLDHQMMGETFKLQPRNIGGQIQRHPQKPRDDLVQYSRPWVEAGAARKIGLRGDGGVQAGEADP